MTCSFIRMLIILLLTGGMAACSSGPGEQEKSSSKSGKEKKTRKSSLSKEERERYLEAGSAIAQKTGKTLKSHLQKALQEGDISHAIQFCSSLAYPLTDSLSEQENARIKRTSHKVRNPRNAPDDLEQAVIASYLEKKSQGLPLKPTLKPYGKDSVAFHAPIMAQPLCLNCHGTVGETIQPDHYKTIREHYPEDKATGFKAGDLRGIWSIRLKRDQ